MTTELFEWLLSPILLVGLVTASFISRDNCQILKFVFGAFKPFAVLLYQTLGSPMVYACVVYPCTRTQNMAIGVLDSQACCAMYLFSPALYHSFEESFYRVSSTLFSSTSQLVLDFFFSYSKAYSCTVTRVS